MTVATIFVLLVIFQLKHFLADYVLQGEYMLGKFKPGWDFLGPLLAHVTVHALLTYNIAYWSLRDLGGAPFYALGWAALLGLGDATVHFFMDRVKAGPKYMGRWKGMSGREYVENLRSQQNIRDITTSYAKRGIGYDGNIEYLQKLMRHNTYFWWALGFDQMVHHLTHYGVVYAIVALAGLL